MCEGRRVTDLICLLVLLAAAFFVFNLTTHCIQNDTKLFFISKINFFVGSFQHKQSHIKAPDQLSEVRGHCTFLYFSTLRLFQPLLPCLAFLSFFLSFDRAKILRRRRRCRRRSGVGGSVVSAAATATATAVAAVHR